MFDIDVGHILKEVKSKLSFKEWADEWGRKVGVGGVTTKGGKWPAGDDDELDAFRHAFVSAVLPAWYAFFGSSGQIAKDWSEFFGGLNEVLNSRPNGKCSRAMDLHNNSVGRDLAPSGATMIRWILSGRNPHKEIALLIADALRSGKLITHFNDPRMPAFCHTQSKVQGEHYIWRTRGDEQVRWDHLVREGKIFRWDNPPEGGHPGADHNCRCWAEPYEPELD